MLLQLCQNQLLSSPFQSHGWTALCVVLAFLNCYVSKCFVIKSWPSEQTLTNLHPHLSVLSLSSLVFPFHTMGGKRCSDYCAYSDTDTVTHMYIDTHKHHPPRSHTSLPSSPPNPPPPPPPPPTPSSSQAYETVGMTESKWASHTLRTIKVKTINMTPHKKGGKKYIHIDRQIDR